MNRRGSKDSGERHPYASLAFCLAWAGFAVFWGISVLLQGGFKWMGNMTSPPSNPPMVTPASTRLLFYGVVVGAFVSAGAVLVSGIRKFLRDRNSEESRGL